MRPASLKHILTKPALLIAAGLVLLSAAAGRAPVGGLANPPEGERSCRAAKPSFDALCRCLGASLAGDDDAGFAHVGLHAAFEPAGANAGEPACGRSAPVVPWEETLRIRLRTCPVGPSPPRDVSSAGA